MSIVDRSFKLAIDKTSLVVPELVLVFVIYLSRFLEGGQIGFPFI